METFARITALCLVACVLAVLLRKNVPEVKLLLVLSACALVAVPVALAAQEAGELLRTLADRAELETDVLSPVFKCVAIAVVCRLGGDLCRDAGESALASLIDLSGAFSAVVLSIPLLKAVLALLLQTP